MIPQFHPVFDEEDAKAVYDVVKGGYLNERTLTHYFERTIADYVGSKYALATSSGTAAIFLALKAVGVNEGELVSVPDLTMIGTANAVKLAGGIPFLVDGEPPEGLKKVIVHLNGRPSRIPRYGPVVEDAAQCLGSKPKGTHLGSKGTIGCFSFATTKIITCGGGGMVVTDNRNLYLRMKALKDQGRSDRRDDGSIPKPDEFYPHEGYNFRLDEMRAALGLSQFKKLPVRIAHKRHICRLYREAIGDCVEYPETPDGALLWYFDILSDRSRKIRKALSSAQIGFRRYYRPIHRQPQFEDIREFPKSDRLWKRGIYLPSSSDLTDEQVMFIAKTIRGAVS